MFLSCLLLAISSSIDSLGIGITYGLKKIELKKWSKIVLFSISILITFIAFLIGSIFKNLFNEKFFKLIGTLILVVTGLIVFFKTDTEE